MYHPSIFTSWHKHYAYFNIVMPQSLFSSMTNAAGFQLYGGAVITVLSSKTSQVENLDFCFRKQKLNLYLSTQKLPKQYSPSHNYATVTVYCDCHSINH